MAKTEPLLSEYLLQMKNIVKTFPGVRALDGAAITVKPGEVVALCGENGAGKSTLMKCLYGSYHADEGEITKAYARELEQNIQEQPHLWLWTHNRWKWKRPQI